MKMKVTVRVEVTADFDETETFEICQLEGPRVLSVVALVSRRPKHTGQREVDGKRGICTMKRVPLSEDSTSMVPLCASAMHRHM